MKYYNFIRILKIHQEKRCFLRQIFHESHVKFESLKKKNKQNKNKSNNGQQSFNVN